MSLPPHHLPAKHLGDFELVRELGRGGMGVVYEAVQTSLGRHVALKVLGSSLGLTPQAVTRFRREAAAAAKLHHTNIVPVYATGEEGGTHFYAMELVPGPSLDRVLKQLRRTGSERTRPEDSRTPATHTPGSPTDTIAYAESPEPAAEVAGVSSSSLSSGGQYFDSVARMVAGVADALDYAHKQGVVHRDIKPANLLLAPDGRLSLNDFGLARVLEEPGMTTTGEFLGTPAYMSPEQITGGRVPSDHRTDIYSLGASLYELLTLWLPFPGSNRDQVLSQILHKEPVPPRKLNPRVPLDLETICLKCLEKDPDRRYPTAGALAEDLRRYLNRFAISARRAGPVARLVKWARRKPGLAAALGGLLIALNVAGFFAWESRRTAEREREGLRHAALDKALTAALAGDFPGAKQTIDEAEHLGAANWEVHLLNGYLHLHTGRSEEAIADFRQAVTLRGDSVMALALLSLAYSNLGDWAKAEEVFRQLDPLPLKTPEDLLFKGLAVARYRPEDGLPLMDQAIRQRPSNIAYLLRATGRTRRAIETATVPDAEAAVEDAEIAKRLLPDQNPLALWTSVRAYLAAATAYRTQGSPGKAGEALKRAERDAEALSAFPHISTAVITRLDYQHYRDHLAGRMTDMAAELRTARERTGNDGILWSEVLNHYQLGRDREALEVLNNNPRGYHSELFRVYLLRELHDRPEPAHEALNAIAVREDNTDTWSRRESLLLFLGDTQEAAAEARRFRDSGRRSIWLPGDMFNLSLNYLADDGRATEADLLGAIDGRRGQECLFCYTIGLRRLAAGDREGAKSFFRRSADTLDFDWACWDICLAFLSRMERNPNWPRWIPPKK